MNPTIASCRWFHWRPKNQKSDPLPSPLWLNHSDICSMGRDSVIQKFFFFWTDLSPCYCFDSLWSCCFYLGYHHQKEGKKYQHLSISYLNTHFQHPFYSRTWQLFYVFPSLWQATMRDLSRLIPISCKRYDMKFSRSFGCDWVRDA